MTGKDDARQDDATRPVSISAIVPVYNGERVLASCLQPLARMLREGEIAELVVVDDGSTDASAWIAAQAGAKVLPSGGRLGPGGARNRGAAVASGEVLWFVDADVVVHPDAARVLHEVFARSGAAAVFGTYDEFPAATNFLSQYKNLAHRHHHVRAPREAETFWAGCGAVRAAAFHRVGGFDAERYREPSIEDIELGVRLRRHGCRILIEPELQSRHLKEWRFAGLLRTDVVQRAYPWAELLREHRIPPTLNVGPGERLRAALAWALALSAAAFLARALSGLWVAVLFGAAIAVNLPLFSLFRRVNGTFFALRAIAFHQFHYLYASAAYVACRLGWTPGRPRPSTTSRSA
ncbi:MAG TPA: glycosyltransferase [Casimicrobiaceae bacterium]|nr:glycosyltransferase [Casimicrobiaceae bacterium]